VYQGEEIGMTNGAFAAIDAFRDVESLGHYAAEVARGIDPADVLPGLASHGRDNARTPMQWDASAHAGFTTGTPWIDVAPSAARISVAAQADDPRSVLAHYRALIRLRHELSVVVDGDFRRIDAGDPAVFAFVRRLGDEQLLVVANLSSQPRSPDAAALAAWHHADVLLANVDDVPAPDAELAPWTAVVRRRAASGDLHGAAPTG
jgi:oligo-1,6-glucosidase